MSYYIDRYLEGYFPQVFLFDIILQNIYNKAGGIWKMKICVYVHLLYICSRFDVIGKLNWKQTFAEIDT